MNRFLLLAALLCAGCTHAWFTGQMDLDRVGRGEAYVQHLSLPGGREIIRVVVVADAPAWRVMNMQRDIEDYPLWQAGMLAGRTLSRSGDDIEAEFNMEPIPFHTLGPLRQHIHIDPEKLQTSLTAYENDWMRNGQIVVKLSPLGDGQRTLINFYFQGEVKFVGASLMSSKAEERFAQTALNIRKMVTLPQYGTQPPAAPVPAAARPRVAVPTFTGDGVEADVSRTLTRVFAEELMQRGEWTVSTPQEIAALLAYHQQESLLGCDDGGHCALDLSKALGTERIVVGHVGKVGERYIVTAALMKMPEGLVEKRVSRDTDQAGLVDGVRSAAAELERP